MTFRDQIKRRERDLLNHPQENVKSITEQVKLIHEIKDIQD